jgi:serine/threonine-protein kinase
MIATGRQAAQGRNGHGAPLNEDSAAERYEVLERVGDGTLFVVYRVRDRTSNQVLALKALKGAYNRHLEFTQNIARAAQRVRQLSHPHLEHVREVGEEEGTLYIVSDWLAGPCFEEQLKRAPLRASEVGSMLRQTADALCYLHGNGVIHGDIRPRQILSTGNRFWLTDIGYVNAFTAAGMVPTDVLPDAVYYNAPERFDGEPPTEASDLYSLGVVLYRALTGRVPFDGPSTLSISMRHRNDTPLLPSQFNPSCPQHLEDIALRLLAKDPRQRYESAAALLEELTADGSGLTSGSAASGGAAPVAYSTAAGDEEDEDADASGAGGAAQGVATALDDDEEPGPLDAMEERARQLARRRRERRDAFLSVFWMLVAIGLLGGILYGMYYFWLQEIPPEVKVPNYVGMSQDRAQATLAKVGLGLHVQKEIYNRKKPPGTVLDGDTPQGKNVRAGRGIEVRVSRGEEPIAMPDFAELSLDQARTIISGHGMRLGQVSEQFHETAPKGYICGQYPEPGQPFRRSEPITLIVSRGQQSDNVPSTEELPPPSATDNLDIDESPGGAPESPPGTNLVTRAAHVRVTIPRDAGPQDVRIVVFDANGEHTEYEMVHDPGDVIAKRILVTRAQGDTGLIRVYVGLEIVKEIRV